jgi:2-hydroxychromene-2-carboxylate isomerase
MQAMKANALSGRVLKSAWPRCKFEDSNAVKHITFHLDFISPYAYLAFEQLPEALKGISYSVDYRPVLFAGMLKHHGQLGPAEVAPKRDWTYRQVLWLAHTLNIPMQMPASHPFNPLPLLRLAIACNAQTTGQANRYVCESIFRHVWRGAQDAGSVERISALTTHLAPAQDVQSEDVKRQLKKNTDDATAQGVFGVPAFVVDDKIFWGLDALPMLRDYLLGAQWFQGSEWDSAGQVGTGIGRITK